MLHASTIHPDEFGDIVASPVALGIVETCYIAACM